MKRWTSILLITALLVTLLGFPSPGMSVSVETATLVEEKTTADGMIRVWLSSFRANSTYNLTISGTYTLNGKTLSSGSAVKVEFSGGTVYVTANGTRTAMGSSVTLGRSSGGVKISQSLVPSNVYPGDMRFFYSGGTAYVVCYLYIEDYVSGVLPYEMDNSFPLEALKAQAVAARTYAIRAKSSSGVYDVTDTTTHQVFRGVDSSKARCIQAVNETWGIVLKYNGSYVNAYYSASNGGQTEGSQNAWGGSALAYLQIKDDPFDLANTQSVKKSYKLFATSAVGSSVSAYTMIRNALAGKLGGSASNYTINEVTDVLLHTPKNASPSKLYSKMQVTVRYNGSNTATVDIPIFSTVKSTLGLGINGTNNEMFTVEKESDGFRIISRRYGHGVGMSQRGAQQMANDGYNYAQILGFYYTGVQRVRMNFTANWPTVSPTPVPEEPVATVTAGSLAKVSVDDAEGRLNLRKEADTSSTILGRIPNGETVTVLGSSGSWCQITYGALTGYVNREYLVFESQAISGSGAIGEAAVTVTSGTLNLRSDSNAQANVIGKIPNGVSVTLLEKNGDWAKVAYNGLTGYVMSQYLTASVKEEAPQQAPAGSATVTLDNTSETLNLRLYPSGEAAILSKLRHGTVLEVLVKGEEWAQVRYDGMTGYVMNLFVAFAGDPVSTAQGSADTSVSPALPMATPSPAATAKVWTAKVTVASGNLNLRERPNSSGAVLTRIPNKTTVTVSQIGDGWCEVSYKGYTGYVQHSFLTFEGEGAVQSATVKTEDWPAIQSDTTYAWAVTNDGDRVNLRKTASSSSLVLIRVPYGELVKVLQWGESWTKVTYGVYTGYMATSFLSGMQPLDVKAKTSSTTTKTNATAWVYTQDGGSLNLRKQTSVNAESLALIPSGAELTVIETGERWYKVIYKGLTGYVMMNYLSLSPITASSETKATVNAAPEPAATEAASAAVTQQQTVYGDAKSTVLNSGKTVLNSPTATLHLRAEPDDLAQETGKIGHGASVEVLQYYGSDVRWVYVRSGSAAGYALSEHFRLDYKLAVVKLQDTDGRLAARASASASSEAVDTLQNGTAVTVLSVNNGWAKVRLGSGKVAYVSAEYIQ